MEQRAGRKDIAPCKRELFRLRQASQSRSHARPGVGQCGSTRRLGFLRVTSANSFESAINFLGPGRSGYFFDEVGGCSKFLISWVFSVARFVRVAVASA